MKTAPHLTILEIAFIMILALILYSCSSDKLTEARTDFAGKKYYQAAELYKSALPRIKNPGTKAECLFQIAECYRQIGESKTALSWYSKAISAKCNSAQAHLYKARALEFNGQFEAAQAEYAVYKNLVPSDPAAEIGIKSAEIAQKWTAEPTRYVVENMRQFNSKDYDFSPFYMNKKKTSLVFTSRRPGATGKPEVDQKTGLLFTDLFITHVDKNGRWDTPQPLPAPINSSANEGSCWVNAKGDKMYFTRCNVQKKKKARCSIYVSQKKGETWSEPEAIGFNLDDFAKYDFRHPALSPDESVMVFQSDLESLKGDTTLAEPDNDLYISYYDKKTKTWSAPKNLGPEINTRGKEAFPFIRSDGTLFYSSDGRLGMGGLDIYKAERLSGDKWEWGHPANMKAPVNSVGDDFGIIFEPGKFKSGEERGYLTSNRVNGMGKDDIYSFHLAPLNLNLEGVVLDCKYKDTLQGALVRLQGSDGSLLETSTDKKGHYGFSLHPNVSYQITVLSEKASSRHAKTYLNLPESNRLKVTTLGQEESKTFEAAFCLPPVEEIEIPFPRVEYDLKSANLRKESKDSLNFVYELLTNNPSLVIELAAHTDTRGSDPANLKLSIARAQSCYDYLIQEKKIDPHRIVPRGYGKRHPLITDSEIAKMKTEQEKELAHQKNRRTVIRVLKTDYHDPSQKESQEKKTVPVFQTRQEDYGDDEGTGADNN